LHFKVLLKMENNKYLDDLSEIKNLMSKSTQFISLSGFAGILAGFYAVVGAYFAHQLIENHLKTTDYITLESYTFYKIIGIALLVLVASVSTAFYLSYKKAHKNNEHLWNSTSKRLLINFCIPLVTGGILIILFLKNGIYGLVAPMTLIFYGLACVNASKYTFKDVRYLGILEIILGLIAVDFSGYGLWFWVVGFGILHIIYGAIMYVKYDK